MKLYRKNVAVVVINSKGLVLACHRSDIAGAWQLPQGGIDREETPEQAMWRELREEIGTDKAELLGHLPEPIRYDWPEHLYSRGFHGQEQYYFLVRLHPEAKIDLNSRGKHKAEFNRYAWLTRTEFESRLEGFKADAYRQALTQLSNAFPGTITS